MTKGEAELLNLAWRHGSLLNLDYTHTSYWPTALSFSTYPLHIDTYNLRCNCVFWNANH